MRDRAIAVDAVVEIVVDDAAIVRRMSGRRVHPASGRTYHIEFNPPATPGRDDISGEALIQRDDDREETVRERLRVYHAQTRPLVSYYSEWCRSGDRSAPQYIQIDGSASVVRVRDTLFEALEKVSSEMWARSPVQ